MSIVKPCIVILAQIKVHCLLNHRPSLLQRDHLPLSRSNHLRLRPEPLLLQPRDIHHHIYDYPTFWL